MYCVSKSREILRNANLSLCEEFYVPNENDTWLLRGLDEISLSVNVIPSWLSMGQLLTKSSVYPKNCRRSKGNRKVGKFKEGSIAKYYCHEFNIFTSSKKRCFLRGEKGH